MIKQYPLNRESFIIKSDLAGESPIYLYWPQDQSTLLYSVSITELLDDPRVLKPLKVSNEGLSFLLQSGVVPPPKTAYEDIYILGIGDKADVSTQNGKVVVNFSHEFPFMNANRLSADEMQPDEDLILQMLAEATINGIDESKPSFLFHSAGKDSNTIALALAEAGWQGKVTFITHKSKGASDESEISAKIAKQLGFKHQVLNEVDLLQAEHYKAIEDYFINAPFSSTDNVTLAYPLYAQQLPKLKGANIIDGGGNDSHMMTPPTQRERNVLPIAKFTHHASFMRHLIQSESLLSPLIRTPAEWCGMSGLSFADTKKILPEAVNTYSHWENESQRRSDWDIFDFKTDMYSTRTISEMHIRKARNFSDSINANLILPFANEKVAQYFSKMPEQYLFDRKSLKNKLILREMLKNKIGLDSDALGKMGFSYDSRTMVLQNWDSITKEIHKCTLWKKAAVIEVTTRWKACINDKGWSSGATARLLYRIFLLSMWHNYNKYLN